MPHCRVRSYSLVYSLHPCPTLRTLPMFRRAFQTLTLFYLLLPVAAPAAAQDDPVPFVSFEYLQGPPLEGRLLFDSLEFNDITMGRAPATGNDRFIVEVDSATGEILRQLNAPVAAGNFQWHEQGYYSYS